MSGRSGDIHVRPAVLADADLVSTIHGETFRRGWSETEVESLLSQENVFCLIAERRRRLGPRQAAGFAMIRQAGEEAEVLSIAVRPAHQRRGIGRALMEEALRRLYRDRTETVHLEVDSGNVPAVHLYESLEFRATGERTDYYRQGQVRPRAALVMSRQVR